MKSTSLSKSDIRFHYDLATPLYWLVWGPHIHHGYWERGDETPAKARIDLINGLACLAGVCWADDVIDVGCGMGGASVHLASHYGCSVCGITLSPVQAWIARARALWHRPYRWHGAGCRFLCADVEKLDVPQCSADVVWSVECTEHLFDKPGFFRNAASWLRPGGKLAIAAWLGENPPEFLCPSLGTLESYQQWMTDAGLRMTGVEEVGAKVWKTWEICERRMRYFKWLGWLGGRRMKTFVDSFGKIKDALRDGRMQYGLFAAVKEG